MGWDTIALLLINNALPVVESIWQKATSGAAPTQADWDELKALAKNNATDRFMLAVNRAGMSMEDPKVKALLAVLANQ